jgi:hypothetical protein
MTTYQAVESELDDLIIGLYCRLDDEYEPLKHAGKPGSLTDTEMITLGLAQGILGKNDCAFQRFARENLMHLFPGLQQRSGYRKRAHARTRSSPRLVRG